MKNTILASLLFSVIASLSAFAATCPDLSGTYLFAIQCKASDEPAGVEFLRFPDPQTYRVGGSSSIHKGSRLTIKQNACNEMTLTFKQNNLSYKGVLKAGVTEISQFSDFKVNFSSRSVNVDYTNRAFLKKVGLTQHIWNFQKDNAGNLKIAFTEVEENTFKHSKVKYSCVFAKN